MKLYKLAYVPTHKQGYEMLANKNIAFESAEIKFTRYVKECTKASKIRNHKTKYEYFLY